MTQQATPQKRQRIRRNGRLTLVKRPDAASNAKPATVFLWHGLGSSFLRKSRRPDMRSAVGRACAERRAAWATHIDGSASVPVLRLVEHEVRISIVADAIWARLNGSSQTLPPDDLAALLDVFLKVHREERETLKLLGLKRHTKPMPTLHEVLQGGKRAAR